MSTRGPTGPTGYSGTIGVTGPTGYSYKDYERALYEETYGKWSFLFV